MTTTENKIVKIPCDGETGLPLLEVQSFDLDYNNLIVKDEIKKQLERIITEFNSSDILSTYNLKHKSKILLYGNPGTGKKFTAQSISSLFKVPLINIRLYSVISSSRCETINNYNQIFDYMNNKSLIVLLELDKLDIAGKRRIYNDSINQITNDFLEMFDYMKGKSIFFVTTNQPHIIGPDLCRRFDDVIYYESPDEKTREELFRLFLKALKKESGIDYNKVAKMTDGFSPLDIKMVVVDAFKLSILDGRRPISGDDLTETITQSRQINQE